MTRLTSCRTCKAEHPFTFLPMGNHPPANSFVRGQDLNLPQPAFPLDTQVCLECGLIQVDDQVPAGFFEHYLYVPSSATLMHSHFSELATRLKVEAGDNLIVDIGCNDGLLLAACNKLGCKTLGVDPAANLAEIARSRGVDVDVGYFSADTAEGLVEKYGPAKAIVTTNTFNHIGDLHDFMRGVVRWLKQDGVFVIEVPWARNLLENNEFDTVYHEHVSEFSLLSIVKLGEFFDLKVVDVHRLGVHGGSMRVTMQRTDAARKATSQVGQMLAEEQECGMQDKRTYIDFADRVHQIGRDLRAMLDDLKAKGIKVAGYGAPAKGNTLLNYFQIGPDRLEYLVDKNTLKQGLYSPGMNIPIRSLDALRENPPEVLLVLAWNFFDEIRDQQHAFTASGGRFLVPLPSPTLVQ